MAKFRVAWTIHKYEEDTIDAESFDDAKKWFDDNAEEGELFFIEDENGRQIIYDCV